MHIVQNHYASVAQIFYDPPKGVLNTMFSVPQGMSFFLFLFLYLFLFLLTPFHLSLLPISSYTFVSIHTHSLLFTRTRFMI